ncbi:MAG: spore maturation protein [Syntrophomonadaceae bacterium]|nr:spore maturation protein [Syntrophomonadaceae bacterium]
MIVSRWAIPVMLFVIPAYGFIKRLPVYQTFVEGAEEGFTTAIRIIPYLVAMMVSIGVFRASGAMELLAQILQPLMAYLKLPADLLPLAFMRPLSGSAALGLATELIRTYGPDSFIGRLASTMQGTTDTTFFVLTIYFGSVGIRYYRHAVIVGLMADFTTLIVSIIICQKLFS